MKKTIPYICTVVYGLLGGVLIQSFIGFMSIMTSPFSTLDAAPFANFCFLISVLSAILIIVMVIVNATYLINLENKRSAKIIIFAEILIACGICFWFCNILTPIRLYIYRLLVSY